MSLSRKHYQFTAKIVGLIDNATDRNLAIERFAEYFAKDNPRFNRSQFINACIDANLEYKNTK